MAARAAKKTERMAARAAGGRPVGPLKKELAELRSQVAALQAQVAGLVPAAAPAPAPAPATA